MLFRASQMLGCLLGLLTALPAPSAETHRYEFVQPHMGTLFGITLFATDAQQARAAADAAFARVAALNLVLSDYDPHSEMMRLCAQPPGNAVPVSADLGAILEQSQRLAVLTEGAFDVTLGPIVRQWRQVRREGRLPPASALAAARASVGHAYLELDRIQGTVTLQRPNMQLDFGGIGKGYAAHQALLVLARQGCPQALVAASGDLALGEPPPGAAGWNVAIGAADGRRPARQLTLARCGVSTSGDAEQFVEIDGVRYSHIVDPRTGLGLTRSATVTVIARNATLSDGFATAFSVMGPGAAKILVDRLPEEPLRVVVQQRSSEGALAIEDFGSASFQPPFPSP